MDRLRIDKWLWAARFYKTRTLAADEVAKGRIRINGVAVKPSRDVKVGDTVELHIGQLMRTTYVQAISDKRGPASAAALLFTETDASLALRAAACEQHRLAPEPSLSFSQGRPTKRERRETQFVRDWRNHNHG